MKNIKRICIVANGNISETALSQIHDSDAVIGVDRAAFWLISHGIIPDVAIGDFDSVTKQERIIIEKNAKSVRVFPKDKDATDLELAIDHAITLHPKEVMILGAIGTRFDHSFVAVQLLEKFIGSGISAVLRDEKNECVMCNAKHILLKNTHYKYFSVLPVTDEIVISITGCEYPLKRTTIRRGISLGVSNEIVSDEATITIHKGAALIIRSND
jgi:thiamine pyrophosphokinase